MNDRPSIFDDRRFPDLILQARQTLRQRLDEDGSHRPISTDEDALLVASALLIDHLADGLSRLGDHLRAPLLELLGLTPRGSHAARAPVRFTFETPLTGPVEIPAGAEIATGPQAEPFTMISPLRVSSNEVIVVHEADGDLMVGLAETAGSTTVALSGLTLGDGPWESFDGARWHRCPQRPAPDGETRLEIRPGHALHTHNRWEAAWLRQRGGADRLRQTGADGRLAGFGELRARTVEATAIAVHARRVADEPLGISDGTAGQQFRLASPTTTVAGNEPVVETVATDGVLAWTPVVSFAETKATDRHVMIDTATGKVLFPPAVRRADGSRRAVGAVPPSGAVIRIDYWTGGGAAGNVATGALRELRFTPPGVRLSVENPVAARGGRDAETIDDLWARAPRAMQARDRAVTAADHEELARSADPSLARVRCVPDRSSGAIRVLLVASPPPERAGRPSLEDLRPTPATLAAVTDHLEPRRILGARLLVESPGYQGISVDVGVITDRATDRRALRLAVLDVLYAYLHPVTGGDDGTGWAFGQAVTEAAIRKHLYPLPGVQDLIRVALSPVELETGARSRSESSISLIPTALPLSVDHRVEIAGG